MAAYAHPEVLVETDWVATHLNDPKVRIAEVDYDPAANYDLGHVPGSVLFDWRKDINDPARRDILTPEALTELFRRAGVSEGTTVVLYGDFNNWFAAFAFWVFAYYGAKDVKLMNGGRKKWIAEDRPLTKEAPKPANGTLRARPPDTSLRVFLDDVRRFLPDVKAGKFALVDVRGPKEFSGEITAPPEYPNEHAQRGGHIRGRRTSPGPRPYATTGRSSRAMSSRRSTTPRGSVPASPW